MYIDFSNFESLVELMKKANDFPNLIFGENDKGEFITTSISHDKIVTETLQNNDRTRKNIYHIDGTTEEIYID